MGRNGSGPSAGGPVDGDGGGAARPVDADLLDEVSEWRRQRPALNQQRGDRDRVVSTSATQRIAEIVDGLLDEAGKDGERVVAWTRLAIGVVALLVWPLSVWHELRAGVPSAWTGVVFIVAMCAFSGLTLRLLRAGRHRLGVLLASIAVDAVLILGFLATFLVWHGTDYRGVWFISAIGLVYLALLGAGVRLSRRGVVLGGALYAVGLSAIFYVDATRNADVVEVLPGHLTTIGILVFGSAAFAFFITARTRRLVLEGANQAVLADRARARLGAYVSDEVAREAMATTDLKLGGVRRHAAILFTDLRGFTTYAEELPPEDLVEQLNRYLEVMVGVLHRHDAYVDKFIGDAIMAVFGVPKPRGDDAARALRAAFALDEALAAHNRDRARLSLPPLRHGVGVHFGPVVAGNVGTSGKANYTVIGDAVNLASRLESSTKDRGVAVLLSKELVEAARGVGGADLPATIPVGSLKVKGREREVEVLTFAPQGGGTSGP